MNLHFTNFSLWILNYLTCKCSAFNENQRTKDKSIRRQEKKLSHAFSKSLMVVKLKFNQTFFELYKLATLFLFY